MKKTVLLTAFILCLLLSMVLTGCGETYSTKDVVGKWERVSSENDWVSVEIFDDGSFVYILFHPKEGMLKSTGTCKIINGTKLDLSAANGETVTLHITKDKNALSLKPSTATIEGYVIELDSKLVLREITDWNLTSIKAANKAYAEGKVTEDKLRGKWGANGSVLEFGVGTSWETDYFGSMEHVFCEYSLDDVFVKLKTLRKYVTFTITVSGDQMNIIDPRNGKVTVYEKLSGTSSPN